MTFDGSWFDPEDGYELWLRYRLIADEALRGTYQSQIRSLVASGSSPSLEAAVHELRRGLRGLLGVDVPMSQDASAEGALLVGITHQQAQAFHVAQSLETVGRQGFALATATGGGTTRRAIAANTDVGVLYGAFSFLSRLQRGQDITEISVHSRPRVELRVLDHWDNLDRTIERGYAGFSLWDWHKLPDYIDPRYRDYARACASVGINGCVLTNVNANALVLTEPYVEKVAALARVFRPYGVRVYLTARFSAPIELDGLPSADPLDPDVKAWWRRTVDTIYRRIPDFGGFVVKANSEGQPGPQTYHRSHAEGANLLADAVGEHGGSVMWRAFVYDHRAVEDRAKQAYNEFSGLDGQFRSNVLLQVKNGPIDFQPREPHHPLFGAMPSTPLLIEFQLTQEYLGGATHLVYVGTQISECLRSDTYAKGEGSTVARVVDGTLHGHSISAMAAVANTGTDRNWCGHPFAAANWYAFGRLSWDHDLPPESIAREWTKMTFGGDPDLVEPIVAMMMGSWQAAVSYMTPLGLHHQMALNHHYGPGPWVDGVRPDWTSVYYHRAAEGGIGFDRTSRGSGAAQQYCSPLSDKYESLERCPEELLLWFHHVRWDHALSTGRTLWNELCHRFQEGVRNVDGMAETWETLRPRLDERRFEHVRALLEIQRKEARWWRDACLLYYQKFSRRGLPREVERPKKPLEYYRGLKHYYVPGIENPFVPLEPGAGSGERRKKP